MAIAAEIDRVSAQAERLLTEDLYWFPVRHHSPTAAYFVEQAIEQRRPKLLLLEAPAGMEPLIDDLVHDQTKPPVALYCSFRDDHGEIAASRGIDTATEPLQLASWFPLQSYSPEYVAIRSARAIGAQIVFIDLPHYAQALHGSPAAEASEDDTSAADGDRWSEFLQGLADAAGQRSWDETWDSRFEIHHGGALPELEDYRRKLSQFCAAARSGSAPDRPYLTREAFMWERIQSALREHGCTADQAMVVCGGFHLYMPRQAQPPSPLPNGTVHRALVPYSDSRTWEHAGYGAGNRAPRYYQRLYTALREGQADLALQQQAAEVLHRVRAKGERVAAADAIAVRHHAVLLAQLRGRPAPILDDLDDALLSCCVKGDPEFEGVALREVMLQARVGNRVGSVAAAAGMLPLVRDYRAQLEQLELADLVDREDPRELALDRRQELDQRRSAFLHRLAQLQVPLAQLLAADSALDQSLFKERWRLCWSPEVQSKLIERSLDGDSVEAAAGTALQRELNQAGSNAKDTCRLLLRALAMDLPQLLRHAQAACTLAVDEDQRLLHLADALTSLRLLQRRTEDATMQGFAAELIERAWDRACFAVPEVAATAAADQGPVIDALKSLAEVALTQDHLDSQLLISTLKSAVELAESAGMRAAYQAILLDLGQIKIDLVAAELAAYAHAGWEQQLRAGEYLQGLLRASTTAIMLGASELVVALDRLIVSVDGECFLTLLPSLRAAIEQLHRRHRDAFIAAAARHLGVQTEAVEELLGGDPAAHALIAELDQEVARIMADFTRHWEPL